jgi:hypothetical protein
MASHKDFQALLDWCAQSGTPSSPFPGRLRHVVGAHLRQSKQPGPGTAVIDGPGWQGFLESFSEAGGEFTARLRGTLPPLPSDGWTPDDTNNAEVTLLIAFDHVRFRVQGIGFGGDWSGRMGVELGEIVGAPDHYPLIVASISNPEDSVNKFRLLLWPNYSL